MADGQPAASKAVSPPTSPRRPGQYARPSSGHVPLHPSRLREATALSPDDTFAKSKTKAEEEDIEGPPLSPAALQAPGIPAIAEPEPVEEEAESFVVQGQIEEPSGLLPDARTSLLANYHDHRVCGLRNCNHGTFSPRARSIRSFRSSIDSTTYPSRYGDHGADDGSSARDIPHGTFGESLGDAVGGSKSMSTIKWLAKKNGITRARFIYLSYYFPFLKWIRQYQWSWFRGDLVSALTMASFYIPMSLSYASNLGHIPPINGLYSFVFNPLIYAFLGTCPQMVVGPEAAGSLLVGSVVKAAIDKGESGDDNDVVNAQIAGVVTAMAGAVIFTAGIARLGFLDSVLSRPFLRGFISAIGFVIIVDQAIPELGLSEVAREQGEGHGSSAEKLAFLVRNIGKAHRLTAAISFGAFAIIMFFRTLKRKLQPRYPGVAYFPDRFIVVALSAVLAWHFGWDKQGLDVLGEVKSSGGTAIPFHWPFQFRHTQHIDTAMSTSFLIALLGFFESSVAAKSLGEGTSGIQGMHFSPNRELIALGTANVVGGFFMALPAFGGYGRSKVNASTGGTTPMSSILLSIITLLCIFFLLPYFYFLPKGVLSAMVSVVAYSLIEECPHDIKFFFQIRGWTELFLMSAIFLATVFYSLSTGIALGIGLSLLILVRHATKPRIQILGKVPGTSNFENAELTPENIEYIEGCLIVKIPEPLTFANTGQLKTRLRRLEHHGTNQAHPSLPRVRHEESNRNIIFDVHGVTSIDGSGTQVLSELVEEYVKRGIRVFFCRLPHRRSRVFQSFERSGIVAASGGVNHFVGSVEEALRLSEAADLEEYFERRLAGHERDTQW